VGRGNSLRNTNEGVREEALNFFREKDFVCAWCHGSCLERWADDVDLRKRSERYEYNSGSDLEPIFMEFIVNLDPRGLCEDCPVE
jgi:hypothetical protein